MRRRLIVRSLSTYVFPNEPVKCAMRTVVPGPKSMELYKRMNERQEPRTVHFFADYGRSKGNYIADADGNMLLDVFNQIASISIGYNNPKLIEACKSDSFITAAVNRPSLGINPPTDWPQSLERIFMQVAPKGLSQVTTLMCGSCSNETAYKAAFMKYMQAKRGKDVSFTEEEIRSCMLNHPPGSPELSILSFTGAFHGRLIGCLSTTRSKPIHKLDIPAFDWPVAPFPSLRYPLNEHEEHNKKEEDNCLERIRQFLSFSRRNPVAGIIVEPIQGEGGDNHATPYFFRGLRQICLEKNIAFIVDEVQTGIGATGKFWAHEHWDLEVPPDMVTFSKKAQAAGFYHNLDTRPNASYRSFNTWLGEPIKALQFEVIINFIKANNLLSQVTQMGVKMRSQLQRLADKYASVMKDVRGQGTMCAFDLADVKTRDVFLEHANNLGVHVGGSGVRSVRLRPMLIFGEKHLNEMIDIFDAALAKTINKQQK